MQTANFEGECTLVMFFSQPAGSITIRTIFRESNYIMNLPEACSSCSRSIHSRMGPSHDRTSNEQPVDLNIRNCAFPTMLAAKPRGIYLNLDPGQTLIMIQLRATHISNRVSGITSHGTNSLSTERPLVPRSCFPMDAARIHVTNKYHVMPSQWASQIFDPKIMLLRCNRNLKAFKHQKSPMCKVITAAKSKSKTARNQGPSTHPSSCGKSEKKIERYELETQTHQLAFDPDIFAWVDVLQMCQIAIILIGSCVGEHQR